MNTYQLTVKTDARGYVVRVERNYSTCLTTCRARTAQEAVREAVREVRMVRRMGALPK